MAATPACNVMSRFEDLPYRPCVGTMVLNPDGLVFIGRRSSGPGHVDLAYQWQMPQGGIDPGEDPWPAALRELYEETNMRSVEKVGEARDWLSYDLPREAAARAWGGRYRGQTQKWYALRFTGKDSEIDILHQNVHRRAESELASENIAWKDAFGREVAATAGVDRLQHYFRIEAAFRAHHECL